MEPFLLEDQFERPYGPLQQEPKIHTKDRARERRFLEAVWLRSAGAPTRSQQSNTDQQRSLRNRWSSSTSSRIASGS